MAISTFTRIAAAIFLLCASALPAQQQPTRGTAIEQPPSTPAVPNGKYYALIIGINDYPAPLPKLKTAENDAQAIAKTLHDDYGFDVKIVLGHDATRNNILAALNQYETTLQSNDNLIVYYAGHGYENKTTGKAYWLPVDADSSSNPNRIIADDITSEMAAIPARHVLLISDSCYSGGLTRDTDVIPQSHGQEAFLQKMLNGHSRTLMASGGDEPVSDSGKDGHSAFAYAVLQALVNTNQALFTASDLFYDGTGGVQQRVSGNTQQVPQYAVIRNSGHDEGDFVFTRKNATTAEIAAKLAALGPAFNRGAALYESKHYFAALPLLASACDAKSFRACSYLGLMYEDGHGVPQNIVRAIGLFMRACDNGDGKGCNDLAILYNNGTGLPKDLPKAISLWQKACDGNYAISCSSLAALYAFGPEPHDFTRAGELFNKNCDEVSQNGCRGRGIMYEKGMGAAPDLAQAQILYGKGCGFGDGQSCIKVGIYNATKSPPDYALASSAYRRACDLGIAGGCELLGYMFLQGQSVPKDDLEAAALYGQACDSDPASGCTSLGTAYENEWGVAHDDGQAAFIFRTGCDAGDANSCRNLGNLYETGSGVPQDYAQALALYGKACDALSDVDSCSSLASLYEKGNGVPQDFAKAIKLYRDACDVGGASGCIDLGTMYEKGTGIAQDKTQAIALYSKACDAGSRDGCTNLKRLKP